MTTKLSYLNSKLNHPIWLSFFAEAANSSWPQIYTHTQPLTQESKKPWKKEEWVSVLIVSEIRKLNIKRIDSTWKVDEFEGNKKSKVERVPRFDREREWNAKVVMVLVVIE